ncbi:MAG: hypothetical protein UR94_C0004G0055 [Parcubacteria group bacterium GW2011_GWA2_36_10]|nr:MAG: hypothetical protein UR94_C0004G0055 [Parcubacteria group bacterium GW2011_GWA2_36_10]
MCSKQLPVNMEDLPMKVFRPWLLISVALLSLTMSCQSIALASPISGNNGQASDDATLTADMLTSTQNVLAEEQDNGQPQTLPTMEVSQVSKELMLTVNGFADFLDFSGDLTILPISANQPFDLLGMTEWIDNSVTRPASSNDEMITEQAATILPGNIFTSTTAAIGDNAVFRPSSGNLACSMTQLASNGARTDHNS